MLLVGIYKITSPPGKVYIGQSWDIRARFNRYNYKRGTPRQPSLNASFKKYGVKNHKLEIVYLLPPDVSQETMDAYEEYYISAHKAALFNLMNIRDGGSRGRHSQLSKDKIRKTLTGRKRPQCVIDKLVEAGRAFSKTEKGIERNRKGGLATKGKITSRKTRLLQKLAQPSRVPICVYNKTGEMIGVYLSQHDAAIRMGIWQANISSAIRTNKPYKRFIFCSASNKTTNGKHGIS